MIPPISLGMFSPSALVNYVRELPSVIQYEIETTWQEATLRPTLQKAAVVTLFVTSLGVLPSWMSVAGSVIAIATLLFSSAKEYQQFRHKEMTHKQEKNNLMRQIESTNDKINETDAKLILADQDKETLQQRNNKLRKALNLKDKIIDRKFNQIVWLGKKIENAEDEITKLKEEKQNFTENEKQLLAKIAGLEKIDPVPEDSDQILENCAKIALTETIGSTELTALSQEVEHYIKEDLHFLELVNSPQNKKNTPLENSFTGTIARRMERRVKNLHQLLEVINSIAKKVELK